MRQARSKIGSNITRMHLNAKTYILDQKEIHSKKAQSIPPTAGKLQLCSTKRNR